MLETQPKYAIIVAGGAGLRMGSDIPKQFLVIAGLPVLMHTLTKFHAASPEIKIILVLPASQQEYWRTLCNQYLFDIPHKVVNGGNTRFQSVKNGLDAIAENSGLVAIHDGVRPCVSTEIILSSYQLAKEKGCAVVAVPMKDSLRVLEGDSNKAVERIQYRIIQTPQTFQVVLIKKAFKIQEQPFFTDDASVAEYSGYKIHLIEGSYDNIKITTPEDLILSEHLLKN